VEPLLLDLDDVRGRVAGTILTLLVLAPRLAFAQSSALNPAIRSLAETLTEGIALDGPARIAVLPIADGVPPYATRSMDEATDQLRAALESTGGSRPLRLVGPETVARAAGTLGVALPASSAGALLIGVVVDADYVVVGWSESLGDGQERLEAEMYNVSDRRRVRAARADLLSLRRTAVTARAAAPTSPTPAPAPTPPARVSAPEPPSVPAAFPRSSPSAGRRVAIIAVLAAAGVAGGMAYMQDRELAASRARLLTLPPGDTASWDREFAHAQDVEQQRRIWMLAAVGSAVTGGTLALLRPSDHRSALGAVVRLTDHWSLDISANRRVSLRTTF
jgi:hypothetical protein